MTALEMMGNELLDIDDGGDEEDLLQHVRARLLNIRTKPQDGCLRSFVASFSSPCEVNVSSLTDASHVLIRNLRLIYNTLSFIVKQCSMLYMSFGMVG